MKGIAKALNVKIENVILVNIFYEVSSMCTSIVVRNNKTGIIEKIFDF